MRESGSALRREISDVFPALSFYYGLSFTELANMPRWAIRVYVNALDRLLAESESTLARAAAYPNLKKSGQQDYIQGLRRRQRQRSDRRSVRLPKHQFGSTLSTIGIGYTPSKKESDVTGVTPVTGSED